MRVVVVRVNSEGTHILFSLWEPLFRISASTLLLFLQTKLVVLVEINFEGNHILFSLWEPLFRTSVSTLLLLLLLSFANKTTYIQKLSSATLLQEREETERRQICRKT
jgi:hypothetical protein